MRDAAAAARRPRVLLGGVDANTRAVARVALGDRVDVSEAGQGERARSSAPATARPDLVILDWRAPGRPPERVGALRADALTRDAKVLLLVDYAQAATARSPRRAPTSGSSTPFSPLQLQVKLRKLLGPEAVGG